MTGSQAASGGIAPPEPELTADEMVRRASAMRPALRERQARCEEMGRILEETNQEFLDAGFYRILQPRRFGGYEFGLRDFARVMVEVARGCPESGWVLTLTAGHTAAFLAGFEEQAQREVYGADGDVRAPGVALPGGMAIPAEGGYRVKGGWDYASGCDVATHFLGSTLIVDPGSGKPQRLGYALFDRAEFGIVNNWDVVGMQGTGSRKVVVEEMLLPAHRLLPFMDLATGEMFQQPGRVLFTNPLYLGPFFLILMTELVSVAVGTARGALDLYDQILREKKMPTPPFTPRVEMAEFQHHFGHAQGLIDTAEAALLECADRYMEMGGRESSGEEQRRVHRVLEQCLQLTWDAVELMFRTAGSGAARRSSALARYFKNLAVIRTHLTVQMDHTSINVGRVHFGMAGLTNL
jgi:3-hydroxy-9,10-secoandrosta-1,3,5(10)-triene-9,17-dione monooxygenase